MNNALHFIGFKDPQRYVNAVRIFGEPDFIHRWWDHRAEAEIMPGDTAVFASEYGKPPRPYSYDDSAVQ